MSEADRIRWDERYRARGPGAGAPSAVLLAIAELLPRSGRALDLAGGAGRHSVWLAQRGLQTTLVDISPAALELASSAAARAGVTLRTVAADLEAEPPPEGAWDLVLVFHYLSRPLYRALPELLAPGGVLACVQPTRTNLKRHERPSAAYLLEEGELPALLPGLEILRYDEGWLEEGRHEARLVGRRPAFRPQPLLSADSARCPR
jgi:tellurite methyltransferase